MSLSTYHIRQQGGFRGTRIRVTSVSQVGRIPGKGRLRRRHVKLKSIQPRPRQLAMMGGGK